MSATNMITPGQPIDMTCSMLFACGTVDIDATAVTLTTDQIYLGDGATIKNVPPAKAARGDDGTTPGASGTDGTDGSSAFDMTLTANRLMTGSGTNVIFISQGGAGGDGGNGVVGQNNMGNVPAVVPDAKAVVQQGPQVNMS